MAKKKITDLQLRAAVTGDLNFPSDDTLQSYRVTGAQVLAYITANITLPTTGDMKPTLKVVADAGWIMANDGTIGNAASGGTTRANADTEALFTLIWNNLANTEAAVSGGRGASAAADFAANKTIAVPKLLGRALGIAGAGTGLTARVLGKTVGAETHQLTAAEMPSHTHTQNPHSHVFDQTNTGPARNPSSGGAMANVYGGGTLTISSITNTTATNQNTGGDDAHNNMQPTTFVNIMIKL